MALKTESNNPLDYLNKLLEDNGLEIILPDVENNQKEVDEKKEEEKKKTVD